jgi:hypothetical protein
MELSPGVGAFLATWFARRHRILLGLSLALVAAAMGAISNLSMGLCGIHSDFPGVGGALTLGGIVFAQSIVVAAVGTALGYPLGRGDRTARIDHGPRGRPDPE